MQYVIYRCVSARTDTAASKHFLLFGLEGCGHVNNTVSMFTACDEKF